MNSLIFLACVAGVMTAGFLLGAFFMRDLAQIDAKYWKSMCELNTNHWQRMYELERNYRETTDVTPASPDESASDEQEGESLMSGQGPFYQLWAETEKLREINAELLAACACEQIMEDCSLGNIPKVEMEKVLKEHGWDETEYALDFVERIRRDAIAKARGTTSPSSDESSPTAS